MESNITPDAQYKQVTVDIPEDRVAEFHAFFGRFLAREGRRRGRRGRHGGRHQYGRRCVGRRPSAERRESAGQPQPTVEPTEL